MTIANPFALIKVIDQEVADYLATSGFSYTKEGDVFVFGNDPEVLAILNERFEGAKFVIENKLRF